MGDGQKIGKPERIRQLQQGQITRAVINMLDALNERPIYQKTTTARPLIEALEKAYRTRISRSQQDAQEFLQVEADSLCDEYMQQSRRVSKPSLSSETLFRNQKTILSMVKGRRGGFVFGKGLFFEDVLDHRTTKLDGGDGKRGTGHMTTKCNRRQKRRQRPPKTASDVPESRVEV